MNTSLQEAIEGVYEAFHDVPRPKSVDGCPCCIDQKGVTVLLTKPLRKLSPDELTHYASSAFLTVGAVEDFLYFLPRIVEILATESGWWPDPEVVTRAMHTSGFHSWPDSYRRAVSRFLSEMIDELLANEGTGYELDSWICALGRLHIDLDPYLKRVAEKRDHLIEYYEVNSQPLIDGRLSNGFWDKATNEHKQVIEWFRSAEIQSLIKMEYGLT